MTDKKLHLKITTHERVVFDEDVDEISSRSTEGSFGVLPGHIPFMCPLDIGVTKVVKDGKAQIFTIMGGIFQLQGAEALILTNVAERAEEIDVERAIEARKRAQERLENEEDNLDVQRAEIALARATARIKATGK